MKSIVKKGKKLQLKIQEILQKRPKLALTTDIHINSEWIRFSSALFLSFLLFLYGYTPSVAQAYSPFDISSSKTHMTVAWPVLPQTDDSKVTVETQIQEVENVNVVHINTALLAKYNSPLIPELDDCLSFGKQKCLIALAISGNESHFGKVSAHFNAFGWNCMVGGVRFNCGWKNWHEGMNGYMRKADGYLLMFNGTKQSILNIAHKGYYSDAVATEAHQQQWVNNVWAFYLQLQK
jgi:hypothetical protein